MDLERERELLKVAKYGRSFFVAIPAWLARELNVVRREYVYVRRAAGRSITYQFVEDYTRERRPLSTRRPRPDR